MEKSTPSLPHFIFTVPEEAQGKRLDNFLTEAASGYTRSYFKQLIQDHGVKVQGSSVFKPSFVLKSLQVIEVTIPPIPEAKADGRLIEGVTIFHEHEHFLIINKPAGLVVHKAHTHDTQLNLVDWLLATMPTLACIGIADRPGIVHRLDKNTSGLMLIARTNYGHATLSKLFKDRKMRKTYRALVQGHPPALGVIDFPIGRHPSQKHKMTCFKNGLASTKTRDAQSHFRVIEYFKNAALVEIKPLTGRTHQIRVHMAAIGHPLLGDETYNPEKTALIDRHALHAHALQFSFDGQEFSFESSLPHDMQNAYELLKKDK